MNPGGTIYIFKTNISNELQIETLRGVFETKGSIVEWSVDMEDVDKVLRVVCTEGTPDECIDELKKKGLNCEELPG